jgi:hypothetical protein
VFYFIYSRVGAVGPPIGLFGVRLAFNVFNKSNNETKNKTVAIFELTIIK